MLCHSACSGWMYGILPAVQAQSKRELQSSDTYLNSDRFLLWDLMSQQQNSNTHDQVKCFCLNQTCAHALTNTVPSACTKILSHIVGNCGHHCIVYQYRELVCFRCCGISCNCCSTFLARPDFICGEYGSDVERRCFRPFLQNSAVPCILLTSESSCTRTVIQKLNETEALFDQKTLCYELKIKGLLCEIFGMILCEHQNDFAKFIPAN